MILFACEIYEDEGCSFMTLLSDMLPMYTVCYIAVSSVIALLYPAPPAYTLFPYSSVSGGLLLPTGRLYKGYSLMHRLHSIMLPRQPCAITVCSESAS